MLPLNSSQIPTLYKNAMTLQQCGDHLAAQNAFENIISINKNVAEAHFQLGRIALNLKKFGQACKYFAKAAALKPGENAIWDFYIEALLRFDDKSQTKTALGILAKSGLPIGARNSLKKRIQNRDAKSSVRLGGLKPQHIQELLAIRAQSKPSQVEKRAKTLIQKHPKIAILHNILAESLHHQNKNDEAEKHYIRALKLDPEYAEGHSHYGIFLLDIDQPEDAIQHLETARSKIPGSVLNLIKLAEAYHATQNNDLALSTIDLALKSSPNETAAYVLRGKILIAENKHDPAVENFKKAVSLGDNSPQTLILLASSFSHINQLDTALNTLDALIEKHPQAVAAYDTKISILQTHGAFDQADIVFKEVLKTQPTSGDLFRKYSASHKFKNGDPILEHMLAQYNSKALNDHDKSQFAFAISKAMEDIGQYDRVFEFLNPANALVRKNNPFDISVLRKEIDLIKSVFKDLKPTQYHTKDVSNFAPIFITGMPRSGTTLIEQIISSHDDVTSLGELGWFTPECYKMLTNHANHSEGTQPVPMDEVLTLGAKFERDIRSAFPEVVTRVTDKSIQSYMFMGLIWATYPNAKIIVVRRDPRDNLLSIYKNVFPPSMQLGAYDLEDLKNQYLMFVEMLDFWKTIDPDRYHEVHYEDIIANPDTEIRNLISTCGLDWQDKCMTFHQNKRRVDTLSVFQVRQPIYASSMNSWEHYKDDLEILLNGLD